MNHYTGSVPEPERSDSWRDAGACRDEDPELFFPGGNSGPWLAVIYDAKAVCSRCPVQPRCLQYAFENNIAFGVWGGLSERDRLRIRRKAARGDVDVEETLPPATLKESFEARTRPLDGGHLGWSGAKALYFQGASYTPKRAAYITDRGRPPVGQVMATCGVDACVLPGHLMDADERRAALDGGLPPTGKEFAPCGTRSAYQRHLLLGQPIDDACRRANNAAAAAYRGSRSTKGAAV